MRRLMDVKPGTPRPRTSKLPTFITQANSAPPPCEKKPKMIQQNGEDYIVLDELVVAEAH